MFPKLLLLTVVAAALISITNALIPPLSRYAARKAVGGATVVGGAASLGLLGVWLQQQNEYNTNKNGNNGVFRPAVDSMAGLTIFITGASTGIGLESAKRLAIGGPKEIILTARTHSKGQAAVTAVQNYLQENKILNDSRITYKILDLDSLQSIKDEVTSWDLDKIDVLLNNAGVMAISDRQLTVDGVERQMQSNHLGHFLLTSLLAKKLASNATIINVSSDAHKIPGKTGLDYGYMWKGEPNYGAWKSYGQSKLANILFSRELQKRSREIGLNWDVASLHPGVVGTDLGRHFMGMDNWEKMKQGEDMGFFQKGLVQAMSLFVKSVPQGANTHVYLASRAYKEPLNAQYFTDMQPVKLSDFATDSNAAECLWEESEKLCQIEFFEKIDAPMDVAKVVG